jgi:hypothetical protein
MNPQIQEFLDRRLHAHPYYHCFTDFGDAENYRTELSRLRADLMKLPQDPAKDPANVPP